VRAREREFFVRNPERGGEGGEGGREGGRGGRRREKEAGGSVAIPFDDYDLLSPTLNRDPDSGSPRTTQTGVRLQRLVGDFMGTGGLGVGVSGVAGREEAFESWVSAYPLFYLRYIGLIVSTSVLVP